MPEMDLGADPPGSDPLVGTLVDGRYTIERPLASGGMGSVYLARQKNLTRPVAVKVVTNADDDLVERFRREAEALAEVSHPAIVEVHDFIGTEAGDGRCYLVMSYVEGENLEDYLGRVQGGCVGPAEAVSLLIPIVSALVQLHAGGIVHRDIKPANIIRFQGADGRPAVKLVDFGIARRSVDTSLTSVGYIIGTPPYMAPETLMAKPHTPVADVYAFGATFYELLTGAPPHGRGALHEIMARALRDEAIIPQYLQGTGLGAVLGNMLLRDEARRPNALQVLDGLEGVRDELAALRVAAGRPGITGTHAGASGVFTPNRQAATVHLTRNSGVSGASRPGAAASPPSAQSGAMPATGLADPRLSGSGPIGQPVPAATAPTALASGAGQPGAPGLGASLPGTPPPGASLPGAPGPRGAAPSATRPATIASARPGNTTPARVPTPGSRRSRWIWLGPLIGVPVVILVVAIAVVAGRGESDGQKASKGDRDSSRAAGAGRGGTERPGPRGQPRDQSPEGSSARDAAEAGASAGTTTTARPSMEPVWAAAKVGELLASCRSRGDARRLYERAKRLRSSRRPAERKEALAHYQAVLQCAHSDSGQRRYSALGLSIIFRGQGDCASSRTHWSTYRDLSIRAGVRYTGLPRCP